MRFRIPAPWAWLAAPVLAMALTALSEMVAGWPVHFDDAFISFRYARNIAEGHGAVWNPGQIPEEGYTNPLLVVFAAAVIRLGGDPYLASRAINLACSAGVSLLILSIVRSGEPWKRLAGGLLALTIWSTGKLMAVSMLGLETGLYAFFLCMAFHYACRHLREGGVRNDALLHVFMLLAILTRPEAVLLYACYWAVNLVSGGGTRRRTRRTDLLPVAAFLLVSAGYVAWKFAYFGYLLPNSFIVKVSRPSGWSELGMQSVATFCQAHTGLFAIGALLTVLPGREPRKSLAPVVYGWMVCAVYLLFFCRVDTLMDDHGRFLSPLACLVGVFVAGLLHEWNPGPWNVSGFRFSAVAACLSVLLTPSLWLQLPSNLVRLSSDLAGRRYLAPDYLRLLGERMGRYPRMREVLVACGDAGNVPYWSRCLNFDNVGLNSRAVATCADREAVHDLLLTSKPDVIVRNYRRHSGWFGLNHGAALSGRAPRAGDEERWDAYSYVGSYRWPNGFYEYAFFVRKDTPFRDLATFLKTEVLSGELVPLPFSFGTYRPVAGSESQWIASPLDPLGSSGPVRAIP